MTKDFVLYEQALALKELGFDEPCFGYYDVDKGYSIGYAFCYSDIKSQPEIGCLAPTFSQAFKFFREKHNLIGGIEYIGGLKPETTWWDIYIVGHFNTNTSKMTMKYQPYEKAELACLNKLIEIAKKQIK